MSDYEPRENGTLLPSISRLAEAKDTLEAKLPNEHHHLNSQVTALYEDYRRAPVVDSKRELERQLTGLQLTELMITHIMHVTVREDYDKDAVGGYYTKFITATSDEFEARLDYLDSMVGFLKETKSLDGVKLGGRTVNGIWGETRKRLEKARTNLSGLEKPDPENRYLKRSYEALYQFRQLLVDEYHRRDKEMPKEQTAEKPRTHKATRRGGRKNPIRRNRPKQK